MISYDKEQMTFALHTKHTSYVFEVLPSGHLGHLYYGGRLKDGFSKDQLDVQHDVEVGNQIVYDQNDPAFNLNTQCLEFSSTGKGDFREPMLHVRHEDGSSGCDATYASHDIKKQPPVFKGMPHSRNQHGSAETLVVRLHDETRGIRVELIYLVYPEIDIITRRAVYENIGDGNITLERALSMNLDLPDRDFTFLTLDGAWIRERHMTEHHLDYGVFKIDSKKGVSSSDHNPFIAIRDEHTTENHGDCYGVSLIYSGNYEIICEVSPHDLLRVMAGVNSFDFRKTLHPGDRFVTPESVLTFSQDGLSGLSRHFHNFINREIISPAWQNKERPVVYNNWEATFFDFNERRLLKLAKQAKKLGIELFVLDDGWFGNRDDDTSSLGDWYVNKAKLPSGLDGFSDKIRRLGLAFGLWVEPEMVNPDSDLYRRHPEWALKVPGVEASQGRHQLILDMSNPDVRDYLVETLTNVFEKADVAYVKWDMNRNFADVYAQDADASVRNHYAHTYVLGLYDVLERLMSRFPDVLFESCASGGNRFDMGMLYYMPQTWTSDDTDGHERILIQYGTSMVYPPSTVGAHVSQVPNQQTLRNTPLETRFNTAMFGVLGYELDLLKLTSFEKKVIKRQIAFYKKHRKLLQFGHFFRTTNPFTKNRCVWGVVDEEQGEALMMTYQTLSTPNAARDMYRLPGVDPDRTYRITNRRQYHNLGLFGHLIRHAMPVKLHPKGLWFNMLKNRYLFPAETENQRIAGDVLRHRGFMPRQHFIGSGYEEGMRLMPDFSSRVYHLEAEGDHIA